MSWLYLAGSSCVRPAWALLGCMRWPWTRRRQCKATIAWMASRCATAGSWRCSLTMSEAGPSQAVSRRRMVGDSMRLRFEGGAVLRWTRMARSSSSKAPPAGGKARCLFRPMGLLGEASACCPALRVGSSRVNLQPTEVARWSFGVSHGMNRRSGWRSAGDPNSLYRSIRLPLHARRERFCGTAAHANAFAHFDACHRARDSIAMSPSGRLT
mmetsp:Transcript_39496/g.113601  ORF Transcript_39496/g.113601 Transcript_39496/m.113601 type:complete len:212 (+) Transcript_39496:2504-3139(+)